MGAMGCRKSPRAHGALLQWDMRYDAEPAYVLHARPWRETSLLLELLTENHGRIGLVARGVQGPKKHVLRAALQPLQHIRFDGVQRGELAQLRTAVAIEIGRVHVCTPIHNTQLVC